MNVLAPGGESTTTVSGWQQVGYTTQSTGLFNTNPDRVNLHQSYLAAEKACDTSQRDWDWGFRLDVTYGTDADDTQAFGNTPGTWGHQVWSICYRPPELILRNLSSAFCRDSKINV